MLSYPNVKINLGLSVLRHREDGYHEIETVFVPYFGLHDTLEIEKSDSFRLEIKGGSWEPESDLTAKAWHLLASEYGIGPVHIRLTKGSPVGAGLGGGSADAAFALRMMSEIFGLALSDDTLAGLAARLGSDCAFFIYNKPMKGKGRGEILEPYSIDFCGREIRVVVPDNISVSTREAYSGIVPGVPETSIFEVLKRPVQEWKGLLVNDFEKSVFAAHPRLAAIKEKLYSEGAVYASMSGSGSALFGIF